MIIACYQEYIYDFVIEIKTYDQNLSEVTNNHVSYVIINLTLIHWVSTVTPGHKAIYVHIHSITVTVQGFIPYTQINNNYSLFSHKINHAYLYSNHVVRILKQ